MAQGDFWSDRNREKAQEVVARLKGLKSIVKPLEDVIRATDDVAVMIEMAAEDEGLAAEVPGEIAQLEKALDDLETKSLLSGPLDPNSAALDDQRPRRRHRRPRLGRDASADVPGLGQGP